MPTFRDRWVPLTIVLVAVVFIGLLTLQPVANSITTAGWCVLCGPLGGTDAVLNVILFAPFGAALFLTTRRWLLTAAAGLIITILIEALQWRIIPGRDASLGDVIANTAGTALGTWLAVRAPGWIAASGPAARHLALRYAILLAALVGATAWALVPEAPTPWQQWVLQRAPRPHLDDFGGTIESIALNETPLPDYGLIYPERVADPAGSTRLVAVLSGAKPPTRRQAHILSIEHPQREGLYLAQWRDALVFRVHQHATRLRLRPTFVRLDGAFAPASALPVGGQTDTIEVQSSRRAVTLTRSSAGGQVAATVRRTVGLGWTLFVPWPAAVGPDWWPLNAAWLAILLLPIGFLAARERADGAAPDRKGPAGIWPLAVLLAGLLLAPMAAGLSQLAVAEWSGALLGLLLGASVARLTSRNAKIKS
jgi:hypothetical protein